MSAPAPGGTSPPPGRIWYLVGFAIFIAGMATMAVFLFSSLTAMQDGLTRFVVPGERTLTLAAGGYTIFHEPNSVIDGRIYASEGLGGLAVSVAGPGGTGVPLAAAGAGSYTFGGHTGHAVFNFTADAPGDYTIAASYDDGATGPQTVLAVGGGFLSSLLATIFGGLAFAFGGAIIAAIIIVGALLRRRRAGLRF